MQPKNESPEGATGKTDVDRVRTSYLALAQTQHRQKKTGPRIDANQREYLLPLDGLSLSQNTAPTTPFQSPHRASIPRLFRLAPPPVVDLAKDPVSKRPSTPHGRPHSITTPNPGRFFFLVDQKADCADKLNRSKQRKQSRRSPFLRCLPYLLLNHFRQHPFPPSRHAHPF